MATNFKIFREKRGISCKEIAARLDMTEEEYREIEEGKFEPPVRFLTKYCKIVEIDPNTILEYDSPKIKKMQMNDVYREVRLRKRLLDSYVKPAIEDYKADEYTKAEVGRIEELYRFIDQAIAKPVVAFLGPSDAGKSTLINAITGLDALLTQWTPTTAATVLLKHIDDKPSWMNNDVVWIFKAENQDNGWDFRRFNDYDYCKSLKLAGGDLSILNDYCNRNKSSKSKSVDSAVVFLDSEVLRSCDIIDLPGFGTESYAEDLQAQRAREKADIVVFCCQANGFFNKNNDIIFLKDVIHNLPTIRLNEDAQPLSNLLIVATQAHIVGEKNLLAIFQRGKDALYEQLSDEVIRKQFEMDKSTFVNYLEKRFFSYSIENSLLRQEFERELIHILSEVMPKYRTQVMDKGIAEFKAKTKKELGQQIKKYESMLEDRSRVIAEYRIKKDNRNSFVKKVNEQNERLVNLANHFRKTDCEDLKRWETEVVTPKFIERIIRDKQYDKKKAQEYIASNVADLYLAKTSELVKVSVLEFQVQVEKAIADLEASMDEWDKTDVGRIEIPFDVKGAWVGGLAGAGVLGALSLSAASFGSLGGYILVAKGVSILSALGISVGGTAAASSFVAAIGGPVTIAIALSVGTFLLFKKIFGEKWESRLAKQVHETFIIEKVLEQYQEKIKQLWDETVQALNNVTQSVIQKYDEELENMEHIINANDEEELKIYVERYREIRDFFAELPWGGSDIYYVQLNLLNAIAQKHQDTFDIKEIKKLLEGSIDTAANSKLILNEVERILAEKLEVKKNISVQQIKEVIRETIYDLFKQIVSINNVRFYRNEDIRHKMIEGLKIAKTEIDIACAWITSYALDKEVEKLMEKAMERGVIVKIHYGIHGYSGNSGGKDRSKITDKVAEKLHQKFSKFEKSGQFKTFKGNTHTKIFICDDKFYLQGSYNFLSYNPFIYEDGREEIVQYSEDPSRIKELREWYFAF
ncbi:helix-turn-helix domain-containing protein [Thermanaerosceptrum fracticalcis]|uniref:Helix-turn-helix domain-containing protein n=1 Tax=Thermanaerosceptrum fracticalcis TaxID=1712410 RepID=A0A7G6E094_THEFR|nr:dynamin family protein [Thermanaerosceptrum fracticalcis]QNB45498.1 helix-turn-helix domain-containing protein [Thermanaerosceptrum fracticalcis]